MQYMRNMFDGRAKLVPLDNDRYPVFVGRLRGMCSQRSEAGTPKGTASPT
jgi:hypothetical protein